MSTVFVIYLHTLKCLYCTFTYLCAFGGFSIIHIYIYVKVKWSPYRPGVAQKVGRGIALLFHDRGTRRGWLSGQQHAPAVLYSRERPGTHFTGGWVGPRAGLDGRKISPHRHSIPDRPARNQSLYRLSYPAHVCVYIYIYVCVCVCVCMCVCRYLFQHLAQKWFYVLRISFGDIVRIRNQEWKKKCQREGINEWISLHS